MVLGPAVASGFLSLAIWANASHQSDYEAEKAERNAEFAASSREIAEQEKVLAKHQAEIDSSKPEEAIPEAKKHLDQHEYAQALASL